MNSGFVADGEFRLCNSDAFQKRLRELRDSIQARHAEELASAGFLRRLILRLKMALAFRRERRLLEPSSYSLYASW